MANVLFKRGSQVDLQTLLAKNYTSEAAGVDGSFYLTSDTHRLYVAQGKNIVPVNEGVTTVARIADLPSDNNNAELRIPGSFYYVTDSNILCVYNGTRWVQINPDTSVNDNSFSISTESNTATIQSNITDTSSNTYSGSFTVKGTGNIKVSSSGSEVTIDDKGYELDTQNTETNSGDPNNKKGVKVTLNNKNNADSTGNTDFNIISGTSNVNIEKTSDGIEISVSAASINGAEFTPEQGDTTGFTLSLKQKNIDGTIVDIPQGAKLDPVIAVGENPNESANKAKFSDGVATLNVYSKQDIDNKLKAVNAMVMKGSIATENDIPTNNVQVGDTYIVAATSTINVGNKSYKAGDLIIATGTEGDDGYITSGLEWIYVPSGNDTVYQYYGVATSDETNRTYGIEIKDDITNNASASLQLKAGTGIDLSAVSSINIKEGDTQTITVNHANRTATTASEAKVEQTEFSPLEFTIKDYEFDAQGHISKITSKPYKVADTKTALKEVEVDTSAENNVATITTSVKVKEGSAPVTQTDAFELESSSLSITATAGTESANAKVTVDMVWGTF